jgi:hypothetical protein
VGPARESPTTGWFHGICVLDRYDKAYRPREGLGSGTKVVARIFCDPASMNKLMKVGPAAGECSSWTSWDRSLTLPLLWHFCQKVSGS